MGFFQSGPILKGGSLMAFRGCKQKKEKGKKKKNFLLT